MEAISTLSSVCGPSVGPGLGFPSFNAHNFVQEMSERDAAHVMSEADVMMNCQNALLSVKMSPSSQNDLDNNLKVHSDAVSRAQLPPQKLYSDDIPVLEPFPGYYGFDLYHPLCEDNYEAMETKPSTAYFYFKDDQGWTNLYAKKAPTWWTLSYWCQRQPPEGTFIRLTPVYGTSDKQQEVIQRCLEDFMASPATGTARYSMILVGNSLAEYFYDQTTERLCVALPYERPKQGCEYSQFNGKFTCFNSCLYNGGQGNKKPLFLIITLERPLKGANPINGPSEVLGRQCLKFRSCACPKRDKDNNERRIAQDTVEASMNSGCLPNSKRRRDNANDKSSRLSRSSGTGSRVKTYGNGERMSPPFLFRHENDCSVDGIDSIGGMISEELRQNIVQIDGEIFHLILMPAYIPGAASTLKQMQTVLLNTFQIAQNLSQSNVDSDNNKIITDESGFAIQHQQKNDEVMLHAINRIEGRAASQLRELQMMPNCQQQFMSANCSTDSQPNSTISLNSSTLGGNVGMLGSTPTGVEINSHNNNNNNALDLLTSHMNSELVKHDEVSVMNFLQPQIRPGFSSFAGPLKDQQYNHTLDPSMYPLNQNRRMSYPQLALPQISHRFENLGHQPHADNRVFNNPDLISPYTTHQISSSSSAFHATASNLQSFRTQYQPNVFLSSTDGTRVSPGHHSNTLSPTETSGGGYMEQQDGKLFEDTDKHRQVVTDASMSPESF